MKRFTMMLAAVLLLAGAAFVPAKAATIGLDPSPTDDADFFVVKGTGAKTVKFTLTQAADVTINLLGLGLGAVNFTLCTNAACAGPNGVVAGTPDLDSVGLLSTAEWTYANLSASTNYFIRITGNPAFVGLVLGTISAVAATPIPASLLMFLTALGGLGFFAKRRKLSGAMGAAA